MNVSLVFLNLFVALSSFSPIYGYLISHFSMLNRKAWIRIGQLSFLGMAMLSLLLQPVFMDASWHPPITMFFYPVFAFIMLSYLNRHHPISCSFGLTLMLAYLSTELHEVPEFVAAYLGLFGHIVFRSFHSLTLVYTILVFALSLKMGQVSLNKMFVAKSALCLTALFLLWAMYPYVVIFDYLTFSHLDVVFISKRIVGCFWIWWMFAK